MFLIIRNVYTIIVSSCGMYSFSESKFDTSRRPLKWKKVVFWKMIFSENLAKFLNNVFTKIAGL